MRLPGPRRPNCLPRLQVTFIDEAKEFQTGSVGGVRQVGSSGNVINKRFPLVLTEEYARSLSEVLIQQAWSAGEGAGRV